jgi:ubiquinol-cytochrome c reductase cytochrome b subunit
MRVRERLAQWFEERLQVKASIQETMAHPVPRSTASWFYVFGSAALTIFGLQVVTGILLAILYVPTAAEAWNGLQALNHQVTAGWFIRALHGWGSNFMVAIVVIHMVQVFLFGAHKYPRELTWVVGVFLLLLTLGMAFTGQVLRFDQDAYWGIGIGASITSRIPLLGSALVKLLLGGPIIAGATLSRFFALHVFVVPGLLLGFVGLHLLLVLKLGINEWPMPGRIVRRSTYLKEYQELIHRDGIPFVPAAIGKDIVFSGVILLAISACALFFGPFGPAGPPDPTIIQSSPKPDFFFLWLFALLSYLPPSAETPILIIGPAIGLAFLFALPFISGEGEKSWKKRPIAVLTIILLAGALGSLTQLGLHTPWSPVMDAWSAEPIPDSLLAHRTPLERQGALVFKAKQCHNCHTLGDQGGKRGPALDSVAVRLTQDQLIRQVIQGGGNMPAYGKNMSPAETTAVVAFMQTLHPPGQAPARDASQSLVPPPSH